MGVRILSVTSTSDEKVQKAITDAATAALRVAPENLTKTRSVILFSWDSVYSALTISFTNTRRHDVGPDILKLFCRGWHRQHRKLHGKNPNYANWFETRREKVVHVWLAHFALEARPLLKKHFKSRTIELAFITPHRKRRSKL